MVNGKLAPEARAMLDWAHVLRRQVYDVLTDERLPLAAKDAKIAELVRYYRSQPGARIQRPWASGGAVVLPGRMAAWQKRQSLGLS